jgi:hypothetical protein
VEAADLGHEEAVHFAPHGAGFLAPRKVSDDVQEVAFHPTHYFTAGSAKAPVCVFILVLRTDRTSTGMMMM